LSKICHPKKKGKGDDDDEHKDYRLDFPLLHRELKNETNIDEDNPKQFMSQMLPVFKQFVKNMTTDNKKNATGSYFFKKADEKDQKGMTELEALKDEDIDKRAFEVETNPASMYTKEHLWVNFVQPVRVSAPEVSDEIKKDDVEKVEKAIENLGKGDILFQIPSSCSFHSYQI
jgi:hypothetical protein